MTTPFTSTITIAQLRANFDALTANLFTTAKVGLVDFEWFMGPITSLTSATTARDASFAFTPVDDCQLRCIAAHGTADAVNRIISIALTVDNGDTTWVLDRTLSASTTSSGASNTDARATYTSNGTALRLLRGVRYRLTVACTTAGSFANVALVCQARSRRRRA